MSLPGLVEVLGGLASRGEVISYGGLAQTLALPSPGSIALLTEALEALMVEDAERGRPFRAALCRAKTGMMPALGFFESAERLGRFDGLDAAAFVAAERAALFKAAALR